MPKTHHRIRHRTSPKDSWGRTASGCGRNASATGAKWGVQRMCSFDVESDKGIEELGHPRLAVRYRIIEQGESGRVQGEQNMLQQSETTHWLIVVFCGQV